MIRNIFTKNINIPSPELSSQRKHLLKIYILPPLLITIFTLESIFIFILNYQHKQNLQEIQEITEKKVNNLFQQEIVSKTDKMKTAMYFILSDPILRDGMIAKDDRKLAKRVRPVFDLLEKEQNIYHLYFILPSRIILLKNHESLYGELVRKKTSILAEKTGQPTIGIEQGFRSGFPILRLVAPWFSDIPQRLDNKWFGWEKNRKLIGYLEIGIEFQEILKYASHHLNMNFFIAMKKSHVQQSKWEKKAGKLGIEVKWHEFPQFLVINNQKISIPVSVNRILSTNIKQLQLRSLISSQDGKDFQITFIPLHNINGEDLGYIVTFVDISRIIQATNRSVIISVTISIAISLLLLLFFYKLLSKVEFELNVRRQNLITTQKDLEKANSCLQISETQLKELNQQLEERIKRRTIQLEVANSDLNGIISNLADGLLVTNLEGRITRCNRAFLKMFDLENQEIKGCRFQELSLPQIVELIEQTSLDPKVILTAEISLASGRVGQAIVTPICKNYGEGIDNLVLGSVMLIRDITQEKEIDLMKTEFISTVSHELRTPLTSVLGFASIIQEKLQEDIFPLIPSENRKTAKTMNRIRDNMNIIISEAERLTNLINEVLDIAKMEAGKLEWKMESLTIEEVIDRAIAATSALFLAKGLELFQDVDPGLPEVMGDRDRLIQVVINLISNAIKFTDQGSITCRAKLSDNSIIVSIIDTGSGIALSDQEMIFEKFKQVGETLTNKPKGTGLGLPICQQIIQHHGGKIWVESLLGQGSNFSFSLPIEMSNNYSESERIINIDTLVQQLKEHSTIGDRAAIPPKTILVVDDDANIRELLRQSLEDHGYIVKEAENGLAAINHVKSTKPDLIILDVMMPHINGFDTAAIFRNDPNTMGIPIIILSIFEDKERVYRLGIDQYMTKPINNKILLQRISSLFSQEISHKKVLVVEHHASTLVTLSQVLQTQGYDVVEVSSGEQCIEKAMSIKPDMIIVDAALSQEYNLVQTLRFKKGLENILFILLKDTDNNDLVPEQLQESV